ncbi:hypothetical protein AMATHDRAFT_66186 [Amanita thiersii Skay4041]|uniref:DUF6534 domain-containing protein n=1 Tax=Amanita thiersii Skay4041 TaxID=703135 RepID=A0A2A9NDK7_9AGAR|nr:hypothetical protein AMATHDRAFT_66186 [Amanita thiersii Skay4041]
MVTTLIGPSKSGDVPSRTYDVYYGSDVYIPVSGYIWTGSSAVCDVSICVTMIYSLLKNHHAMMSQTRRIVDRLIRLIIGAGTITGVCFNTCHSVVITKIY